MNRVLRAILAHAARRPRAPALRGTGGVLSYGVLAGLVEHFAAQLARGTGVVGVLLDNGLAWAVADLAAQRAGRPLVPLPAFFSDAQLRHALVDAGVESVITDQPARFQSLGHPAVRGVTSLSLAATSCAEVHLEASGCVSIPDATAKITYTSGTTGTPKGVCLTAAAIESVATSLLERVGAAAVERHTSVLPLATLLENIAGLYLPLLAGGCSTLLPLADVGMRGASAIDAERLISTLRTTAATSAVLIPQMLQTLVAHRAELPDVHFLAVGGAPVSLELLGRARAAGLPVYEGYGLSECASVVAVNGPDAERVGSVGRPLPHVRLRFADDGEIIVAGSVCAGYLHDRETRADGWWATGDVGYQDADGFLYITGRKKHMFITAFGRNVAPEWVERELTLEPAIAQAVIHGEVRPFNVAVLVARDSGVAAAVAAANARLPDYARVGAWIMADEPFSVANGLWTGTGRPRRAAILEQYGARLEALYAEKVEKERYA